jgi:hypothetical protein
MRCDGQLDKCCASVLGVVQDGLHWVVFCVLLRNLFFGCFLFRLSGIKPQATRHRDRDFSELGCLMILLDTMACVEGCSIMRPHRSMECGAPASGVAIRAQFHFHPSVDSAVLALSSVSVVTRM